MFAPVTATPDAPLEGPWEPPTSMVTWTRRLGFDCTCLQSERFIGRMLDSVSLEDVWSWKPFKKSSRFPSWNIHFHFNSLLGAQNRLFWYSQSCLLLKQLRVHVKIGNAEERNFIAIIIWEGVDWRRLKTNFAFQGCVHACRHRSVIRGWIQFCGWTCGGGDTNYTQQRALPQGLDSHHGDRSFMKYVLILNAVECTRR